MSTLLAVLTLAAESLSFQNRTYTYEQYKPKSPNPPAILLLHGAGGSGSDMLELWKPFAKSHGIALIAPNLPREVSFEAIAPAFFRALMEHIPGLDKRRLYVFGYSMGGYLTYDAAMFDSDYFAAAGIYAHFISPEYLSIITAAKRKIPIAIYAGAEDERVPVKDIRSTRDLLEHNGFPVHYREFPKNGHNYGAVSKEVNGDVWNFFEGAQLP